MSIVGELRNMADDIEDGDVKVLLYKAADQIERQHNALSAIALMDLTQPHITPPAELMQLIAKGAV